MAFSGWTYLLNAREDRELLKLGRLVEVRLAGDTAEEIRASLRAGLQVRLEVIGSDPVVLSTEAARREEQADGGAFDAQDRGDDAAYDRLFARARMLGALREIAAPDVGDDEAASGCLYELAHAFGADRRAFFEYLCSFDGPWPELVAEATEAT